MDNIPEVKENKASVTLLDHDNKGTFNLLPIFPGG